MNIRIGHIPYLNMVPFHQGFGPEPIEAKGWRFEFHTMSPRVLGLEAEKGSIDAGALSLVDWLRCSNRYDAIGCYGIGVKGAAQSVLLFSKRRIPLLEGVCAVTEETSTSSRLLQLLLEVRYGLSNVRYRRLGHPTTGASPTPRAALVSGPRFDGKADALLLIGDEALRAKKEGIRGFPVVTDLGEEWLKWQHVPFVFARWAVRHAVPQEVKDMIEGFIQKSLNTVKIDITLLKTKVALSRHMLADDVAAYWGGFAYELGGEHYRSIALFSELWEKVASPPLARLAD